MIGEHLTRLGFTKYKIIGTQIFFDTHTDAVLLRAMSNGFDCVDEFGNKVYRIKLNKKDFDIMVVTPEELDAL